MTISRSLALAIAMATTVVAFVEGVRGQTMAMYGWLVMASGNYWLALDGIDTIGRWATKPKDKG
jgi:hypothetical protein